MNLGECYDPLLMLKKDLSLETIEKCILYVCHSEGGMGKTKYVSAFDQGMIVGARRTGLSMLLGFYTLNSFPCVSRITHHPKDIQPT